MKKTLNGRKYDTSTAKKVAVREKRREEMRAHWAYWKETLYIKRTGEHFLHAKGGPSSHYNDRDAAGHLTSGERIIPLSQDQAEEWLTQDGQGPWAAWH